MATIERKKSHTLGKEKARAFAEELANKLKERFELDWAWSGDTLKFEAKSGVAKGVKGFVAVLDTLITVEVDLPLMLRPLKGTVEGKIDERLASV